VLAAAGRATAGGGNFAGALAMIGALDRTGRIAPICRIAAARRAISRERLENRHLEDECAEKQRRNRPPHGTTRRVDHHQLYRAEDGSAIEGVILVTPPSLQDGSARAGAIA